jgi:LSD1 subclass zinc finger protein
MMLSRFCGLDFNTIPAKFEWLGGEPKMNPFINPNKRGVNLPHGCKDLLDVLRGSPQSKCKYCGAAAEVLSFTGAEDYRWCRECQEDLKDFSGIELKECLSKFKSKNVHDEASISQYHEEMERRLDDFMRQRVKERKSH